jgi:hypothetical protein
VTPELDASSIVTRDLSRYYAILGHERPWQRFGMEEHDAILEALARWRERPRSDEDYTLPRAFRDILLERGVDRAAADDATARFVGLSPAQLIAVIDRAETGAETTRRQASTPPAGKTARDHGIIA